MEHFGEEYTAYSLEDLQRILDKGKLLDMGFGLEKFLVRNGFKREEFNLYSHEDPKQLIELRSDSKGISYINKLNEADSGQYIQFLQNRILEPGKVIPNQKLPALLGAVEWASKIEEKGKHKFIKTKNFPQKRKLKRKGI
jgi:hypothetical protein